MRCGVFVQYLSFASHVGTPRGLTGLLSVPNTYLDARHATGSNTSQHLIHRTQQSLNNWWHRQPYDRQDVRGPPKQASVDEPVAYSAPPVGLKRFSPALAIKLPPKR